MDPVISPSIEVDMTVMGRSGTSIGTVDVIVFEPYQDAVLAAVVKSGRWRAVRRLVPARRMLGVVLGRLETDLGSDELEHLERYDQRSFRHPPGSWAPPNGWPPGRVRWPGPAGAYHVGSPLPRERSVTLVAPAASELGHALSQHEQLWVEERQRRYAVDPDDVLQGAPLECCRTPYEWGEASVINPTEKGRQRGLHDPVTD